MYKIKPLAKENIQFVFELMSEENNMSALHKITIPLDEWQKSFAEAENDSDEKNFIVYSNNIPCAWLKLNGLLNKNTAWISMLVVTQKFKRQGVGKFAINFSVDYLKQRKFTQIKLHTTSDNFAAISCYEKCGFKIIENRNAQLTLSRELIDFKFITVTDKNINSYKKLRKTFAKYKVQSLRNQGEFPSGKKMFYDLFDSIISKASIDNSHRFTVMQLDNNVIGFASVSTDSRNAVDIPYSYGVINDFYIFPKFRRNGFGSLLNEHIESCFKANGTNTVLLSPDPVSGIDFWKAMGYRDTGIHQGWGCHFVYIKHIITNENQTEIDNAISKLVTLTDLIGINPYNKPQIKEVFEVWKKYCKGTNRKPHKKDVKQMAFNARKSRTVVFLALYYEGKVIGFVYKSVDEIKYVLPEYKDLG